MGDNANYPSDSPDYSRLRTQALAISEILRLAGVNSMPLDSGVLSLVHRLDKAEGERDAMQRRAEAAESDWQTVKAELDDLRAKTTR